MNKNSNSLIIKILFYFLCAVVPSISVYYTIFFVMDNLLGYKQSERLKQNYSDLTILANEGNNERFIQKILDNSFGMLSEESISEQSIKTTFANIKQNGLGFAHFKFFDATSSIISISDDSETLKTVSQKIFESLADYDRFGSVTGNEMKNQNFFNLLLKGSKPYEIAERKAELIECDMQGKPSYFYWNVFYSNTKENAYRGGILAWFAKDEIPSNFSIKRLIDEKNSNKNNTDLWGVVDIDSENQAYPQNLKNKVSFDLNGLKKILKRMRDENTSFYRSNILNIAMVAYDGQRILYCLSQANERKQYSVWAFVIRLALFLLCCFYIKTFLGGIQSAKLPSYALIMFIVNLIMLLGLGYACLKFVKVERINALKDSLNDYVVNVDKNYDLAKKSLETEYRELANNECFKSFNDEEITSVLDVLKINNKIDRVYIVNRSGKIVYSYPKSSGNDIITQFIKPASARIYSENYNSNVSFSDAVKNTLIQNAVKSFTNVLEEGNDLLKPFENFNQISEFWLTNRRYYVYSNFINVDNSDEPLLMIVWHKTSNFAVDYLKQRISYSESRHFDENARIAVMLDKKAVEMPYPQEYNKYRFVKELRDKILFDGEKHSMFAEIAGKKYIALGSPLKSIPDKFLAVLKPIEEIERKTDIAFYVLLASLLASITGLLLSIFYKFK